MSSQRRRSKVGKVTSFMGFAVERSATLPLNFKCTSRSSTWRKFARVESYLQSAASPVDAISEQPALRRVTRRTYVTARHRQ